MKIFKTVILATVITLLHTGAAQAEDAPLKGMKLGFGFDRGFGLTGSIGKFNGFLGDKGFAVDYLFMQGPLKIEVNAPVTWYIGAGGYGDWNDGDLGVRLPVGVQLPVAKRLDVYGQAIPRFRFNNNSDFGIDFGIGIRYQF